MGETKRAATTKKSVEQLPKAKKAKLFRRMKQKLRILALILLKISNAQCVTDFGRESLPEKDWVQCCDDKMWLHEQVTPTTVIFDICYDN